MAYPECLFYAMEDIYETILSYLNDNPTIYREVQHLFLKSEHAYNGREVLDIMHSLKESKYIFTDTSSYYGLATTIAGQPLHSLGSVIIRAKITPDGIKHYRNTYLSPTLRDNSLLIPTIPPTINQIDSNRETISKVPKWMNNTQLIYWIVGIIGGLGTIYLLIKGIFFR